MRKILVIVLMLAASGFALPDLQVRELQYTNSRLVANIFNQAPDGVNQSIGVKFYDNGKEIGMRLYTDALPRYSVFSAYIDYTPSEGIHELKAVADEDNNIKESNENNNGRTIQFEQKMDTVPRNVTPDTTVQPEKKKDAGEMPQSSGNAIFMLVIAVIILAILLLVRLLHLKGKISMPKKDKGIDDTKRRFEGKKEEGGGFDANFKKKSPPFGRKGNETSPVRGKNATVLGAMKMKSGSAVSVRARLIFNGKAGDEYTYFVKDSAGEAVGVSKEKYAEKECTLECTVESFMKDDKVLRIHGVK